jgi:xanthine dehydrogenase YagT iron-sulfur-binding subunit
LKAVPLADEHAVELELAINGEPRRLEVDVRTTLLDLLREQLGLTGSKKGCDHGQCGACTVLIDGRRANACLVLAVTLEGREVTTIEGLASDGQHHRLQAAFVEHDAFQCGYCTPGQICSGVGMLAEARAGMPSRVTMDLTASVRLDEDEIRERMSGNLCRCAAYVNIISALAEVAGEEEAPVAEVAGGTVK